MWAVLTLRWKNEEHGGVTASEPHEVTSRSRRAEEATGILRRRYGLAIDLHDQVSLLQADFGRGAVSPHVLPSAKVTVSSSAPSTTWLLVRM